MQIMLLFAMVFLRTRAEKTTELKLQNVALFNTKKLLSLEFVLVIFLKISLEMIRVKNFHYSLNCSQLPEQL